MNHLVEILTLKLTFLITPQKHTKNISHVRTSSFALKSHLASLKTEVDKLDINKLVPVPVELSKLSNVVKNVKKTVFNKLVPKVNSIDTRAFVLKTNYDTAKTEFEKKTPDTSRLQCQNH